MHGCHADPQTKSMMPITAEERKRSTFLSEEDVGGKPNSEPFPSYDRSLSEGLPAGRARL